MQLRNGKATTTSNVRCTAQKASTKIPRGCTTNKSANRAHSTRAPAFSVSEFSGMISEFNLSYRGAYQRSHGLCEIYDYMDDHIEAIRQLKNGSVLNIMRKHTIKLVDEATKTAITHGKEPDTLDAVVMLVPKMLAVLAKMGPEDSS